MTVINKIKEIYDYREMIITSVHRELRGRYKGSVLGFLWTFINPLFQLLVYTMVFSVVLRSNIEKYYLYLFVALIPWIFLSSSITGGASCVYGQAGMVTKIYFPRQVLPIAFVSTCFVNMLLCFVVVIAVFAVSIGINLRVLPYLIPTMLIEYVLALGIAFLVSGITVFFRDLEHILGIVVMAWQFLTPIMYPITMVPERLLPIFNLNPMTPVVEAYRSIMYYKCAPDMSTMISALIWGIFFLVTGGYLFERLQRRFAEVL